MFGCALPFLAWRVSWHVRPGGWRFRSALGWPLFMKVAAVWHSLTFSVEAFVLGRSESVV